MTLAKKKIYIVIIAVSIIGSVFMLWLGNRDVSVPAQVSEVPAKASPVASPTSAKTYPVPRVFPENKNFDSAILDSTAFKTFNSYQSLKVNPEELGRDNPFKSY